jgi:RNA polymerase sigma factor (sigma-70 family)
VARQQDVTGVRGLRTLFDVGPFTGLSDGQLLKQFLARRGESAEMAFAALVQRHGPMLLRVCRSVLRDEHDSQDAFQATFLVLTRLAGSLWVRGSLGPWLYRVAQRAAFRAKRASDRRQAVEQRAAGMAARSAVDPRPDDLGVLYEELDRLPERYRLPIVLCDVEDYSYEEASQRLGWPVGTVKSRIARGRSRLKTRLTRRGLVLPAGLLAFGVLANGTRAAPAALLVSATVGAAAKLAANSVPSTVPVAASVDSLMKGVLTTMFLTRVRMIALTATILGVVTLATVVVAQQAGSGVRAEPDRLREMDAKLDRLLEVLDRKPERTTKPAVPTPEKAEVPSARVARATRLNLRKEPIVRMVLAVNTSRDKRIVILEEWMTDLGDPSTPKGYIEFLHFPLNTGRAYRADGRRIAEESLWEQLPDHPSAGKPVLLATDERAFKAPFLNSLRDDTIILVGDTEFRGVGSLPGDAP